MENIPYIFLTLIVLLFCCSIYSWYTERKEDQQKDYSNEEILGSFGNIGDKKAFFVKYKKHQPNKKKAIKNRYFQGIVLGTCEDNGLYKYRILDCYNDEFYFPNPNNPNGSKDDPYVAYIVEPFIETNSPSILINGTNGPVQIVTDNGIGYQNISNNTFISRFQEYKEIMISNGIPESAINKVLNNPVNQDIQKSFLKQHGKNLADIMLNVAGVAISLLDYLNK